MSVVQCRCIVGAVARHRHHVAPLLQQAYKALLVLRSCAAYNFQLLHTLQSLLVAKCCELCACDMESLSGFYSYLTCYLDGCSRYVASYYLHLDARLAALCYSIRDILAHRVGECSYCLKV